MANFLGNIRYVAWTGIALALIFLISYAVFGQGRDSSGHLCDCLLNQLPRSQVRSADEISLLQVIRSQGSNPFDGAGSCIADFSAADFFDRRILNADVGSDSSCKCCSKRSSHVEYVRDAIGGSRS